MQLKQAGLTLVELMVVVAVMAIISAVAYPLYTNQTQKARRADAKITLESIAMAQERFYTINGSYAATVAALSSDPAMPDNVWQSSTSTEGYYTIALTQGTNQDFTATATRAAGGRQANDSCTSFTLNHQGAKTSNPTTGCW